MAPFHHAVFVETTNSHARIPRHNSAHHSRFSSTGNHAPSSDQDSPLINALIAASVGVFVLKSTDNRRAVQQVLAENFELSRANMRAGRWYTLVTCSFNHGSTAHLVGNMHALSTFGTPLISHIGPISTMLLYMGAAVTGGLLSMWSEKPLISAGWSGLFPSIYPRHAYLGASGGVMGIMASFAVLFPNFKLSVSPIPGRVPAWAYTVGFAAYSWWAHYAGLEVGIGHLAHLGGLIFGVGFGLLRRGLGSPYI